MKKIFVILFIWISTFLFSQERLIEEREVKLNNIEIITDGLDDIVIENSDNDQIKILLLDKNPNTHNIIFKEDETILKVSFQLNFDIFKENVFRKYITKRLQKASVVVKTPKNKNITIYGKTISVNSKSYQGDLSVFIDKGNVQLNRILGNVQVSFFSGNISARINENTNTNLKTRNGKVVINNKDCNNLYSREIIKNNNFTFNVNSINGNVNLIRE